MQGTCVFDTGCSGARLLVWLILNANECNADNPSALLDCDVKKLSQDDKTLCEKLCEYALHLSPVYVYL